MLSRLLKPWYLYRPQQILLRIYRSAIGSCGGYRPIKTAWGATILADVEKTIGRSIWTTGVYDLNVSEALLRLIRPGDLVVDAGANIGYMSMLAAAVTGKCGAVISFEPNPELFRVLAENTASAAPYSAGIDARECALGATSGSAELVLPSEMAMNDGLAYIGPTTSENDRRMTVSLTTVDAAVDLRPIGVMKVDVEGFELQVLSGALGSLNARRIRDIVFEDHQGAESEVCRMLRGLGYSIFSIGRRLHGLHIEPAEYGGRVENYEAQSFLATLSPDEACSRCRSPGWRSLARIRAAKT